MSEPGQFDATMTPTSTPFPHIILDNFLAPSALDKTTSHWPAPDWPGWHQYSLLYHQKRASNLAAPIPPSLSTVLARMAALPVVTWFDIPGAVPDLSLHGSGLHEIAPGGMVGPHLDAQRHPRLGLTRVLSALLYVHPVWESGWGGELQLWDRDGHKPVTILSPLPGRLVVMDCRHHAWHAVDRVTCPQHVARRALALFWYTMPEDANTSPARQAALFRQAA